MDRSVDSIGSCSLDVDADSSDISDTSGSLNFPTPISVKDITREFTANIRERCSVRTIQQNSKVYLDPVTEQVCMVLTQPTVGGGTHSSALSQASRSVVELSCEKKPSYLNLACCVNGYSNLTTYDSKIRQDINKSREVSPIRPSSSSIQHCKKNNSLAPPILLTMPNIPKPLTKSSATVGRYGEEDTNNNQYESNGNSVADGHATTHEDRRSTSFIQQRVERLYGPGALAQGFYSPKKVRCSDSAHTGSIIQRGVNNIAADTELTQKFKQLSPSRDYSDFRKKIGAAGALNVPATEAFLHTSSGCDEKKSVDLPVMRHLSQEFRAQLPSLSPKRNFTRNSPGKEHYVKSANSGTAGIVLDEVDHKVVVSVQPEACEPLANTHKQGAENIISNESVSGLVPQSSSCENRKIVDVPIINDSVKKDGNYFLNLLKSEQIRILALASNAEKYIDALSNNTEISEDTLGFLRSASGKARLLVSQKMKQFEGLCHNNLNRSPEEKFPTTADDLQGFWDMVYLQIDHIDAIFAEIEDLKKNDWKPLQKPKDVISVSTTKPQKLVKTGNTKTKVSTSNGNGSKTATAKSAAALKRESQRKQLLEMKRKHRIAMTTSTPASNENTESNKDVGVNSIEIFVNQNCS